MIGPIPDWGHGLRSSMSRPGAVQRVAHVTWNTTCGETTRFGIFRLDQSRRRRIMCW